MTSTNHMHRASAPGSGRLDLSLAGRRASRRTRSQRVAVVVAHVPPALLRSSSMEVLERPSAQDPAKSGHECLTRGTATMSRSSAHSHTTCPTGVSGEGRKKRTRNKPLAKLGGRSSAKLRAVLRARQRPTHQGPDLGDALYPTSTSHLHSCYRRSPHLRAGLAHRRGF